MFFSGFGRRKAKAEEIEKRVKNEKPLDLEKGDLKAIIIAAFITMLPILLGLIAVVLIIYWLLIGRF